MREYRKDPVRAAKHVATSVAWAKRNPEKRAEYCQNWSKANPNYKRDRLAHHQAAMNAFKLAAQCTDCTERFTDPLLLHFHHVDPATKSFDISRAATRALVTVDAEIAKCVVLCSPCHHERHRHLPKSRR